MPFEQAPGGSDGVAANFGFNVKSTVGGKDSQQNTKVIIIRPCLSGCINVHSTVEVNSSVDT